MSSVRYWTGSALLWQLTSPVVAVTSHLCPSQILQEDELVQYKNALQRWEKEKERQQTEFIITDKKLFKTQPVLVEDVIF